MFTVTCESTCDLTYSYLQKRNCPVVFYTYCLDDKILEDNMGRNVAALPKLFETMKRKMPSTSQINTERYEEFFKEQLEKGDVLHLAFSSGLSQSVTNAQKAAENIAKLNLPHKLVVVDSLCGGGGYGLFVDGVLDCRDSGMSFEDLCNRALENRHKVQHYFFSTDLTYFRKSGRVSGATMLVGNVLHLCPIMRVNDEGKIVAYAKTITARKAVAKLVEDVEKYASDGKNYNGKIWLYHSNCFANAYLAKQAMTEAFPNAQIAQINEIGTVMSCHCGPNTVAAFFLGEKRQ